MTPSAFSLNSFCLTTATQKTLFLKIDNKIETLDGWHLKFGFEKHDEPQVISFDLIGQVEQPRVQNYEHHQDD